MSECCACKHEKDLSRFRELVSKLSNTAKQMLLEKEEDISKLAWLVKDLGYDQKYTNVEGRNEAIVFLYSTRRWTQSELAIAFGLSQPRVGQIIDTVRRQRQYASRQAMSHHSVKVNGQVLH
jgi:hypothetical protein